MRSFLRSSAFFAATAVVLAVSLIQPGMAQTFTVLYNFTGGANGGKPHSPVTLDQPGNIYGTTYVGGSGLDGTVFKLTRKGSGGFSTHCTALKAMMALIPLPLWLSALTAASTAQQPREACRDAIMGIRSTAVASSSI